MHEALHLYMHMQVDDMCDFMDPVRKSAASPEAAAEGAAAGAAAPAGDAAAAPAGKQLPAFVLGHSMGGLVAALTALRRQEQLAGVMLHSPALDVEWNPVLRCVAWGEIGCRHSELGWAGVGWCW